VQERWFLGPLITLRSGMSHHPARWIAKTGYVARGIVYFIIGGFALLAAAGQGGDTHNPKGALLTVLSTNYGAVLLSAVAIGLFCYAAWRLFQGVMDADQHGTDAKGLAVRGGLLVSAATHTALGIWAVSAVIRHGGDSGGKTGFAAWLMQQPYGPWLVGLVGLAIFGAGIAHIKKGVAKGYEKWFDAPESRMKVIRPVSTTGLVARGIVFLIVGGLFMFAGLNVNPEQAGGIREAMQWIQGLPFGPTLFLVMAAGLVCFGAYSVLEGSYRRIGGLHQLPGGGSRQAA
jgi:hypothetical protein